MHEDPPEEGGQHVGYDVGHGRPPRQTQFQKGRSGNPAGRPKGVRNVATAFTAAADRPMTVTQNGETVIMSRRDAIIEQMLNKAARGDGAAQDRVIKLLDKLGLLKEAPTGFDMEPIDEEILSDYIDDLIARRGGPGNDA